MPLFRRSLVVMDYDLPSRLRFLPYLRYWDSDLVGRHPGDRRLRKSFENEQDPRPWIVVEARSVRLADSSTVGMSLIVPVASTSQGIIRDIECIPIYPDTICRFPAKKTCIRQMMATVVLDNVDVEPYLYFDEVTRLNVPLHYDQLPEVWEEIDLQLADYWNETRRDAMFNMRRIAEDHAIKKASPASPAIPSNQSKLIEPAEDEAVRSSSNPDLPTVGE